MSIVNNNNLYSATSNYNNKTINNLTDIEDNFKHRIDKTGSIKGSSRSLEKTPLNLEKQVSDSPLPRSKRGANYAIIDDIEKDIRDEVWDEIVIVHGFNPKALGSLFDRQNIKQFNKDPDLMAYFDRRSALKLERKAELALGPLDYIVEDVLPPSINDYKCFAKVLTRQPGWENKGLMEGWDRKPSNIDSRVLRVRDEINSYIKYYTAEYQREHPNDGPETSRYRATERLFNLVLNSHTGYTNDLIRVIEQTTGRKFSPLQG